MNDDEFYKSIIGTEQTITLDDHKRATVVVDWVGETLIGFTRTYETKKLKGAVSKGAFFMICEPANEPMTFVSPVTV